MYDSKSHTLRVCDSFGRIRLKKSTVYLYGSDQGSTMIYVNCFHPCGLARDLGFGWLRENRHITAIGIISWRGKRSRLDTFTH